VLTMDLHAPQIQGFFRIPADHLTAVPLVCAHLKKIVALDDAVVVAADVGEAKDAGRYAKRLDLSLAIIDKRRAGDDERARVAHLVGDVAGRDCLIVDDEIATGGTIFGATDFLLGAGARSVRAAAVHPVLSGDAIARLRASPLVGLTVTDSIPIPPEKRDPRIEVLTVAGLLAEAITRIHDGRSVSDLFG